MRFPATGLLLSCFAVGLVMSENLKISTPDDRSITMKLEPTTTLLKVLEDVCKRLNIDSNEYELRHRDRLLDLASSFRLSGLRNNAELQLVKAKKRRDDAEVEIVIQLESGTRFNGEFKPNATLLEIIEQLCPNELTANDVSAVFMRTIIENDKLGETILKDLGLISGRAIVKLMHSSENTELKSKIALNKPLTKPKPKPKPQQTEKEKDKEQDRRDDVSKIHNSSNSLQKEKSASIPNEDSKSKEGKTKVNHGQFKEKPANTITAKLMQEALQEEQKRRAKLQGAEDNDSSANAEKTLSTPESSSAEFEEENNEEDEDQGFASPPNKNDDIKVEDPKENVGKKPKEKPLNTVTSKLMLQALQEERKRRGSSKETQNNEPAKKEHADDGEIYILGERNAMLFKNDDTKTIDVDVDFELNSNDARNLVSDLKMVGGNPNKPLLTAELREKAAQEDKQAKMNRYKTVTVRVQFPNRYVLQGTFMPNETIGMVREFLRPYLSDSEIDFFLFTAPPMKVLSEELSLFDAKCVPSARLHFGCNEVRSNYLKEEILGKTTSPSLLNRSNAALKKLKTSESEIEDGENQATKPVSNSNKSKEEKDTSASLQSEDNNVKAVKPKENSGKKPKEKPLNTVTSKLMLQALHEERKKKGSSKETQTNEPAKNKHEDDGEIHILGERNAVLYKNDDTKTIDVDIDFELNSNDARNLVKMVGGNPNKPLLTAELREKAAQEDKQAKMNRYKTVTVRVQFPNRYVLQGTFMPNETIGMVREFVRPYLADSEIDFFLFTAPPMKVLSEGLSLFDAKCVPSARLHFGCNEVRSNYLKEEILKKTTSPSLLHRVGK